MAEKIFNENYWVGWASPVAQTVKNLPAMKETQIRSLGWEDSPGEGNDDPLQYSYLENSMDRGAWRATVHGVTKSRTQLSNFTHTHTHTPLYLSPDMWTLRSERPRVGKECKIQEEQKQWEKTSPHTVTTQTEPNIKAHQKTKHLFSSELSVK